MDCAKCTAWVWQLVATSRQMDPSKPKQNKVLTKSLTGQSMKLYVKTKWQWQSSQKVWFLGSSQFTDPNLLYLKILSACETCRRHLPILRTWLFTEETGGRFTFLDILEDESKQSCRFSAHIVFSCWQYCRDLRSRSHLYAACHQTSLNPWAFVASQHSQNWQHDINII